MKTKLLLAFLFIVTSMMGQNCNITEAQNELAKVNKIILDINGNVALSDMFTARGLDLIFEELHQQISGINGKAGKSKTLNGTIDDKGINFNGTIFKHKENGYIGVSASATSKDKFVDLFSSNQLKSIYNIGLNYIFFFRGTVRYNSANKSALAPLLNAVCSNPGLSDCQKVQQTDEIQKKAGELLGVGKSLYWISFNSKYNINPVKIIDVTKPSYTKNFNSEYVSIAASFNYLRKTKNNLRYYISPNLNFSDNRNFKINDIKNINIIKPITIGSATAQEIKAISYYENIEDRIYTIALEIPFILFFNKQNYGLDLSIKTGVNDPDDNNISARFGVYIPFTLSDKKQTITIEPLLRFQKLFGSSHNDFINDNLSAGFNLSISIPEYLK